MDHVNAEYSSQGEWEGVRGESKYVPDLDDSKGYEAYLKLSEYGLDGIEYKNCIPDFSKCSEESVSIKMTSDIVTNYRNADKECAAKWNETQKDGRNDWTPREVQQYRETNKLAWHECNDGTTCQLVPQEIHGFFRHSGGRCECKKKESMGA